MENKNKPGRGSAGGATALDELERRSRQAEQGLRGEQGVTEQAKQKVEEVGKEVTETASEVVKEQQRSLAGHLASLSKAVSYAAERLRGDDESWLASYAEQAADGIERFRDSLESKEPQEVMGQLEDYGRRSPQAFVEIALLGGFLLGRFLKSSSHRPQQNAGTTSRPAETTESVSSQPVPAEGQLPQGPGGQVADFEPDEEVYE